MFSGTLCEATPYPGTGCSHGLGQMKWRLECELGPSSHPVFTDKCLSKTNAAVSAQGWSRARRKAPCEDRKSLGLTKFLGFGFLNKHHLPLLWHARLGPL